MKNRSVSVVLIVNLLLASPVLAMSSTNYQIPWDSVNSGGDDVSTSTNYWIRDTLGDNASGTSTSSNYQLSAGYRAPEEAKQLSLTLRSQSSSVYTAYSAFSSGLLTVTVSSASGFSVGNYIAVIENAGYSQLIAVGKIASIAGNVITVDGYDGDTASMSASPSGGNDYVNLLNSNSLSFGTLTTADQHVRAAVSSVTTDVSTGYSVYLQADHELRNSTYNVITEATGSSVTLGSGLYGAEQIGSTAVSSGNDLGVTTTQRVIQTSGSATGSVPDRVAMNFKVSITNANPSGEYTQNVYFTVTANY